MGHVLSCQALVLRAYNVGEADRFCILFTKERGRMTTRATGVRRPGSRLGGFLLPFRHVGLQLRESQTGSFVSSASPLDPPLDGLSSLEAFACAEEGVELLLTLVQHEQSDPALFNATLAFLAACAFPSESVLLHYQVRLLHILGLLPDAAEIARRAPLARQGEEFIRVAREGRQEPLLQPEALRQVRHCCALYIQDSVTAPLRAASVGATIAARPSVR